MKIYPKARMTEIRIVEVPYKWKELSPSCEFGQQNNTKYINLIHVPTGITYQIEVMEKVASREDVAEQRAKAKLGVIHVLHGNYHLFEQGRSD